MSHRQTPGSNLEKSGAAAAPARPESPPIAVSTPPRQPPIAWGKWSVPYAPAVFLACLGSALVYLLLGPYSNFGPSGYLDPWFYTGYFMHFSYLIEAAGATYYVSRLPWILPGLLVFQFAQPAAATVILNALLIAVSAASVYFVVSWHYGKWPATVAAIVLATNPYFVFSVSWDYPDGPAIAYALVAFAFLLRPTGGRVSNNFIAAVFLALSGFTNMAGIPMLLALLVIPLWRYRRSLTDLVREAVWGFWGGVAATLVLAPFGKIFMGQFTFYRPQVGQIQYVRTHPGYLEHMWGTGNAWIPAAYRLEPFLFLAIVGGALLLIRRKRSAAFFPAYLALIAGLALFVFGEFVLHNVGLRCTYGTTYLLAPALGFAGMLIGECWPAPDSQGPGRSALPRWFGPLLALFALALPFWYATYNRSAFTPREVWTVAAALTAVTAVALFALLRRSPILWLLPCCLIIAGVSFGPASDDGISYPFHKENATYFRTVTGIGSLVDSGLAPGRLIRFWYDGSEPARPIFDSASSLYLWGYVDCTAKIPAAPLEDLRDVFKTNTTFVHLTLDPSKIALRNRILDARGVVVGGERRWTIPSAAGTIYVIMEDVTDMSAAH